MARLFISHSSKDSLAAVAFKQWLAANGWPQEDVFLDLEDIGGGERWKDALRKAHARCEAVILLASPDALASPECLTEVRKAEDFGKEIIVVLLHDLTIYDRRLDSYKERQIVDLSAPPQAHIEQVSLRGTQQEVRFNNEALAKIKDYLIKRGITPESFPWPPEGKPNADPFPGLSAFNEDEAAIFFGRDSDILTTLDEFRLLCNKGSSRFFAIEAASGAGKSSFLRAGLWPRLCRNPDFAPLAILRPSLGIISGPEGLAQKLAPRLSRPAAPINPGDIYTRLLDEDVSKGTAEFVRLMTVAAEQAQDQRRIVNPNASPPVLVFAIDQAEELLAPENVAESHRLLLLVAELIRGLPKGIEPFGLLTVRTESAARLYQAIAEQGLELPKTRTLLPLPRTSYRDVIVKPIDVAARHGKKISIDPALTEQLVADAAGADALPLLAFTLFQLYRGFSAGDNITLQHYEAIGGVAGSIKTAIKDALVKPNNAPIIPAIAEEQLALLRATFIPALARVDSASDEPMRRTARLDEFVGPARAMVERLVEKRLLVLDQRAGVDVVEIAHESLLRQWPPLTAWLHEAVDDLRVVDAVERAAGEWARNGRQPAWLDHRDDRLSAAERVAARDDFRRRLGAQALDYLKVCRAREIRRRHIAQALAWSAAAVFAIFSLVLGWEWQNTLQAKKQTDASLLVAQSELDLRNGNIEQAVAQAAQAFSSVPSVASRSALLQALMEISPHLAATVPLGADIGQAFAWRGDGQLDVATALGRLFTIDRNKPSTAPNDWTLPSIKRPQDGNPSLVRALAPLGSDRMIAVFDEGSIGVYEFKTNVMRLQSGKQPISVFTAGQPVSVSGSGALIALVTAEETIVLDRCDWSPPGATACEAKPLADVHGRAVAISPDGKRIAVGDNTGKLTIYDLSGNPIGGTRTLDGAINALAWAGQRGWLAAASTTGEIAVFDIDAGAAKPIARQKFGDNPITAVAWSPNALTLAFTCDATAVCVWPSNAADADHPFKPAMRFAGHRNAITRLSFDPSGKLIASIGTDNTVRLWTLAPDRDVSFALYGSTVAQFSTVAVSPDHRWMAAGSTDGTLQFWETKSGNPGRMVASAQGSEIRSIAWNSKGMIAALDNNDNVSLVSAASDDAIITTPMKALVGYHLGWADDDHLIAVPTGETGVLLLDSKTPGIAPTPLGESDREAWGVTAVPNTRLLLVSYVGGEIKLWDLASRQVVGSMRKADAAQADTTGQGDKIGVGSLSVNPEGRLLAASSGNRFVTIYDVAKRSVWRELKTDSSEITTVAFSPDGQRLAVLGTDNRLYVWTIGADTAELLLNVGVTARPAILGGPTAGKEHAEWLDWISDDQLALATDIAAISIIGIDLDKWHRRIERLALEPKSTLH